MHDHQGIDGNPSPPSPPVSVCLPYRFLTCCALGSSRLTARKETGVNANGFEYNRRRCCQVVVVLLLLLLLLLLWLLFSAMVCTQTLPKCPLAVFAPQTWPAP